VIKKAYGLQDAAGAMWFDDATYDCEVSIIGVSEYPIEHPDTVDVLGRKYRFCIVAPQSFQSAYFWAILGPRGREKWSDKTKSLYWPKVNALENCEACDGSGIVKRLDKKTGINKKHRCDCIGKQIKEKKLDPKTTFGPYGLAYASGLMVRDPEAIASILGLKLPYKPTDWSAKLVDDCEPWDDAACFEISQSERDLPGDYYRISDPFYWYRASVRASYEMELKREDAYAASYATYIEEITPKGLHKKATPPPKGGFHLMKKTRTFPIMMVGRRAMRQEKGFRRHQASAEEIAKWNRDKARAALKDRHEFKRLERERKEKARQLARRERVVVHLPKRKKKR
jgi:hypothetical protein